ncbi:MAG: YpmA family protein [Desulfitobacteriia bacterium]|jgi:hypothetical protein
MSEEIKNANDKQGQLHLIASQRFAPDSQMYKIVDFLNRSLRNRNLLFGLTKSEDGMNISVYEVE